MSSDNRNTQSKGPNLADILLYLLSKWPWYVLSIAICIAIAWYQSATSPFVYFAQSKVIIKDPSNKTSTGGLDRYDNSINRVNVTNEILQFRSKRLLQEVVARTRADITYTTRQRLRDVNIYGVSPIEVTFPTIAPKAALAFSVVPVDSTSAKIVIAGPDGENHTSAIRFGKMYKIKGTHVMVSKTACMSPAWIGKEIKITKEPELAAVNRIAANLGIRQEEKDGTIINIAVTSARPSLTSHSSTPSYRSTTRNQSTTKPGCRQHRQLHQRAPPDHRPRTRRCRVRTRVIPPRKPGGRHRLDDIALYGRISPV